MTRNAILDEVRTIREAIAKEHNYDMAAIFQMFRQADSERPHVDLSASSKAAVLKATPQAVAADEAAPRR